MMVEILTKVRYSHICTALILFCTSLVSVTNLRADDSLAIVIRSQNMPGYPSGYQISGDSEIRTGDNQKIAVKTSDGDVLVAGQNSSIKLVKPGFFQQLFGRIYYFINKRTHNESVNVRTTTSTIGIRGTTFVVDSNGEGAQQDTVSLSEGQLNFDSNDDEYFKLYELRELNEFELYKRQMEAEFDAYKQRMEEEFIAYKKSIQLDSGYSLKFDGKKVVREPFDENTDEVFREFEAFIR
jgi:hypothetical protein